MKKYKCVKELNTIPDEPTIWAKKENIYEIKVDAIYADGKVKYTFINEFGKLHYLDKDCIEKHFIEIMD